MLADLLLLTALAAPAGGERIAYFEGTLDEAVAKAKAERKPVLIDFFTEW